jgi:hypothetical protein
MNWQTFLTKKPVLQQARDTFDDNGFLDFIHHLYKQRSELAIHAFNEIGWGEGHHYCRNASDNFILSMVGRDPNRRDTISNRLVAQQDYHKTTKSLLVSYHTTLQELFNQFTPTTIKP